jgi:hypothetical protein
MHTKFLSEKLKRCDRFGDVGVSKVLRGCLIKHHTVEANEGMEMQLHVFLTSPLDDDLAVPGTSWIKGYYIKNE